MFKAVGSKVNFPDMEEQILSFWKEHDIFRKSTEFRKDAPLFVLYEGPPTANGSPGIHHVLARVFKDIIPRYKTMKGYQAPRKGGWDTHGLPVELEVERELGLSSKTQIEEYGVAQFNQRCRESVFRYVKEWEAMTDRIAFWVDMENPYVTFDNSYIESCWWIIKRLWDKGLIYQDYKVTPHCPRCGTSLSSHEVALGYKDDTPDPSVYVKFKLGLAKTPDHPSAALLESASPTYFLAWTTTPWTLPGNTALAVSPDADYVVVEMGSERLILAECLAGLCLTNDYRVVAKLLGRDLNGLEYEPLYEPEKGWVEPWLFKTETVIGQPEEHFYDRVDKSILPDTKDGIPQYQLTVVSKRLFTTEPLPRRRVIAADLVALTEGTGIVHIAPAFGGDDLEAGKRESLLFVQPVDLQGQMTAPNTPFDGLFVKNADPLILNDLKQRGLLYRSGTITHTYPFCWRCDSPLLYYAKLSWYIRTTALKERLISGNSEINWYPEHIKTGRFGDWLENNVDWAVSRERYWGTPLPVWLCDRCGADECVGSVAELMAKPGYQGPPGGLNDLHRPFVDEVTFSCSNGECEGTMRRIPEVLDAWFDSGAMPVAQWHYPYADEFKDAIDPFLKLKQKGFPADYICEAVDQTRGWFYTLHALSTLLFQEPCFKNVICLGHILDAKGEKMSKSKGNVVEPWTVLNRYGADALRWYLYVASPPGNPRRFSPELVEESLRKFLMTLWNTYSFFVTYANIDRFDPTQTPRPELTADLDRWILSRLNRLIGEVDENLDNYNPTDAARAIQDFVDDLSNWYVRRSRRRFWKSENDADKLSAHHTLYECLATLSKLLAPFTPFVAEEMYQNLVRSVDEEAPESVHLANFPKKEDLSLGEIDETLLWETRMLRTILQLGRSAREKAKIKVRQPLKELVVKVSGEAAKKALQRFESQLLEELNIKRLSISTSEKEFMQYARYRLVPKYQAIPNISSHPSHPILSLSSQELAAMQKALDEFPYDEFIRLMQGGQEVQVGRWRFNSSQVLRGLGDKDNYVVVHERNLAVALDKETPEEVEEAVSLHSEITPELADEGLARELVHRIQNMRRAAGFDIADHIVVYYQAGEGTKRVMESFGDYIRQETLAHKLLEGPAPSEAYVETLKLDGQEIKLGVRRTRS